MSKDMKAKKRSVGRPQTIPKDARVRAMRVTYEEFAAMKAVVDRMRKKAKG